MEFSRKRWATLLAILLAIWGTYFLIQERLVLAGTLFVFCSFAIYLRETADQA